MSPSPDDSSGEQWHQEPLAWASISPRPLSHQALGVLPPTPTGHLCLLLSTSPASQPLTVCPRPQSLFVLQTHL